jgi:hypothetical protein
LKPVNLIEKYAVRRGADYELIKFYLGEAEHGDLSLWLPKGEVRTNYLNEPNELLESFQFRPLVFGSVSITGRPPFLATMIAPFLTAAQTTNLRIPDRGKNWVYDIFLSRGAERKYIAGGNLSVLPQVTDYA